ncbi:MAG: hypothetical protein IKV16_07185, partial [Clostridia bacterium]|nr:hypothetical protein [Clostridia bacterium]
EAALADMQRATNSKRSIAEIALTRMCDAKTVATAEALAVRVEELEKQISMLKMGVPVEKTVPTVNRPVEKTPEPVKNVEKQKPEAESVSLKPYPKWQSALERIGELKRSLASQFNGSSAYVAQDDRYVVKMNAFFADRIMSSSADMAILRGVIAELESKPVEEIKRQIQRATAKATNDFSSELEDLIK